MNQSDQGSTLGNVENLINSNTQKTTQETKLKNLTKKFKESDILTFKAEQNSDQGMDIEEKVPYSEIRKRLPSVWAIYRFIVDKQKVYLPEWKYKFKKPKWATEKYLKDVMLKNNFALDKNKKKDPEELEIKLTRGELISILEQITNKPLGFETGREPPKEWLVTVIYSLNPDHQMFKPVANEIKRTVTKE